MNAQINWLYGIDGCRAGWVVAKSHTDLSGIVFSLTADLGPLFAEAESNSLVAIDIPIGLPENGPRACDTQARKVLGWPRRNSVFSPPSRQALAAATYPEALRLNREALDTGISKQAFCIAPKIKHIDDLMNVDRQRYVREVHPEVSFAQLNNRPITLNKKRAEGRIKRIAVLQRAGLTISDAWLREERQRLGTGNVALDDLVDALVCLVTAFHINTSRSKSFGQAEQRDAKGLLMEIVTCTVTARTATA